MRIAALGGAVTVMRIPLLIRGPGIPAGRTSWELVANMDIAPTLVELAGAQPTVRMDGRSLLRYARRPGLRSARPILLEGYFGRFGTGEYVPGGPGRAGARAARQPTPKSWKAMVTGRWKLIRYSKGVYELYDLKRDPHELRSLGRRGRFAPVRRFLAARLARLADCEAAPAGPACRSRPSRGQSGGGPEPRLRLFAHPDHLIAAGADAGEHDRRAAVVGDCLQIVAGLARQILLPAAVADLALEPR